jgi:hypothetical protein
LDVRETRLCFLTPDYVCTVCGKLAGGKLDKKEGNLGKIIV